MKKQMSNLSHSTNLSQCVKAYPQFFSETKISLVQKFVGKLDRISRKYQNIDTLFLSNNVLTSLEGMEQFQCVVHLTLANNNIIDLDETVHLLKQLKYLETLTIGGNPLCRVPFFKDIILKNLTYLRQLEGKTISDEDRHQSQLRLKKVDGITGMLLSNYKELIRRDNV